jgi:hypothetical protein
MSTRLRNSRPSPALAVALVALVVAMGGTSYAAITLPAKSVGTKQLKKGAVTTKKIKDASLQSVDFAPGQLPAGPQGPKGDKGDPGTNGVNGLNGATHFVVRRGTPMNVTAGAGASVTAQCNPGEWATGGGNDGGGTAAVWKVAASVPTPNTTGATPTGWRVDAQNTSGAAYFIGAYVICAS